MNALYDEIDRLKAENARLELRCEQATQLYMMHRNKTQVQLRKEIEAIQRLYDDLIESVIVGVKI